MTGNTNDARVGDVASAGFSDVVAELTLTTALGLGSIVGVFGLLVYLLLPGSWEFVTTYGLLALPTMFAFIAPFFLFGLGSAANLQGRFQVRQHRTTAAITYGVYRAWLLHTLTALLNLELANLTRQPWRPIVAMEPVAPLRLRDVARRALLTSAPPSGLVLVTA